jgi:hypothetical protein
MNSFENKKRLRFVVTLATGTFGSSSNNVITLEGFRAVAMIEKAGGNQMGSMRAQIYGVSQSDIRSVTTLQWTVDKFNPNWLEVYAIDGSQETKVFTGTIINAWGDYRSMPDVFLMIQAQSGYNAQLAPAVPTSYKSPIDVATAINEIVNNMNRGLPFGAPQYIFENNGVSVQLANTYLPGTNLEQVKSVVRAAGIDLYMDDTTLAVTLRNSPRITLMPIVSSKTGMIGYPTFDGLGVNFRTIFTPAILFGGLIDMRTDVLQANAQWIVTSINHQLESEKPGGAWFSTVRGNKSGISL